MDLSSSLLKVTKKQWVNPLFSPSGLLFKPHSNFFISFILLSLFLALSIGANENSIFWELESPEGKQIFIFGSIHVDDNRVMDFSDSVNNAMKKSDLFVSETNNVNNLKALEGLGDEYNKYLTVLA